MKTIAEFMTADHSACDNEFAVAEQAALAGNWSETEAAFNTFRDDMARHFRMEEEVLFPTLASAGGPAGPVHVMLMEHEQIKELLKQMGMAVERKDAQQYSGLSETLLMVMQQHNHKEENILYPITDQILAAQRETLLGQMQAV
ncbi:MAG TPA: hemerythrin domain-containing protein [Gallionella sp.]|jgi:iron-sulfur cluster repair protein YtfE (RIC family)|nr:hemerythrin domain-containing protein [Gallionella sp.]